MKFALFGSYGEKNIGDEAICMSILENILFIHNDAEIIIFSHDVVDSKKRYENFHNVSIRPMIATGIRSLYKQYTTKDFQTSTSLLKTCDCVIVGGGGLFYDTELQVGRNPILVWMLRIWLFKYLKLNVVLYAVGIGPVNKLLSKIYLRLIGNSVNKITTRDDYSKNILESCSVYTPIIVSADPVWSHIWRERTMQDINKTPLLKYDARKKMGIQIRMTKNMNESKFIEMLNQYIDRMVEKYLFSIVLIPMSFSNPNDRLLLEKIQVNSKHENRIEILNFDDASKIADTMQECEYLVLTRMHSMILATQLGRPYLALSYNPKTDDLINRLGLSEFAWPVSEVEATILERKFLQLMKKKVTIRKFLLEQSIKFQKRAKLNMDLL